MEEMEKDTLFEEAVKRVTDVGYASVTGLQRDLGVGYSRASRLLEQLEIAGIIGPADGSKPRKVLPLILDVQDYRKKMEKKSC